MARTPVDYKKDLLKLAELSTRLREENTILSTNLIAAQQEIKNYDRELNSAHTMNAELSRQIRILTSHDRRREETVLELSIQLAQQHSQTLGLRYPVSSLDEVNEASEF